MTDAELAEIEARWKPYPNYDALSRLCYEGKEGTLLWMETVQAAPADIAALLAELRRLRGIGEKLAADLTGLAAEQDVERWHDYADKLLCQALRDLGAEKAADIFAAHEKWYA